MKELWLRKKVVHQRQPIRATSEQDSVFRILRAASLCETVLGKQKNSTKAHRLSNRLRWWLIIFPLALAVLFAAIHGLASAPWLYAPSLTALLLAYVGVVLHQVIALSGQLHTQMS